MLRGPDEARHGASRVITGGSTAPAFAAQCGGTDTTRASGRDSCSSTFALPKIDGPLRCCSATCGRAPIGRGGDRCRDDDVMSVVFEDDWGFASRASRERMEPPSRSGVLLFSPITSGTGRFPFPFLLALRGPPATSFRSFRETALGLDVSA